MLRHAYWRSSHEPAGTEGEVESSGCRHREKGAGAAPDKSVLVKLNRCLGDAGAHLVAGPQWLTDAGQSAVVSRAVISRLELGWTVYWSLTRFLDLATMA